jgi:hypothetical protein
MSEKKNAAVSLHMGKLWTVACSLGGVSSCLGIFQSRW